MKNKLDSDGDIDKFVKPGHMSADGMPMSEGRSPGPKTGPMHTNGGKSAGVPVLEKHSVKSGFFQKKVLRGEG